MPASKKATVFSLKATEFMKKATTSGYITQFINFSRLSLKYYTSKQ